MYQTNHQPSWDDLRFFLSVCRQQTVSAAAKNLGVDQTTVSRRIQRLEKVINAKLLNHGRDGYSPTSSGLRLYKVAEEVEASLIECCSEISDQNLELGGTVQVGAPDGFGSYFLAPRLAALCNTNSKLRINLVAASRVFSLARKEIDIAISLAMPKEGRIIGRKLVDYDLSLYASLGYLSSARPIESCRDLEDHSFIGYIEQLVSSPLLDYVPMVSDKIVPRFRSSNLLAQLQAVRDGEGIAVLPRFISEKVGDLVPILQSEVKFQRTLYLLLHEDNRRLARIQAVADYICETVHSNISLFVGNKNADMYSNKA